MSVISDAGYREYRAAKLGNYPTSANELIVRIDGLNDMDSNNRADILDRCKRSNMAIYSCRDERAERADILLFAARFGLRALDHHLCANDDGVSELTATGTGVAATYAPYSKRSLSWHTDGYYNAKTKPIHAVVLHCKSDAQQGGETALLDPEIAYIRLRDEDPAFIDAFEHPECMTIPANTGPEGEIRPEISGPVFSYDRTSNALHMRYSERKRYIHWRDDPVTTAARECLSDLLSNDDGPVLRHRLRPGQGLISNNVLHNRTRFVDGPDHQRFLYRARFFDRIQTS